MMVQHTGRQAAWRALRTGNLIVVILVGAMLSGMFGGAATIPVQAQTAIQTLSGVVTVDDGNGPAGVADAQVIVTGTTDATTNGVGVFQTRTGDDGSYSLALPPGDYWLTVRPGDVTTSSPNWVPSQEPLPITIEAGSDLVQDLTVDAATVTVIGQLAAPNGEEFTTPNRAYVRAENQEGRGNQVEVQADGSFRVNTLPGSVLVTFVFENRSWTEQPDASGARVYYAEEGDTVTVEPFPLPVEIKSATIAGEVTELDSGDPVPAGLPVHAWRADGSAHIAALTRDDGSYRLPVTNGLWFVRAVPRPGETYSDTVYVPAESAQVVSITQTVTVTRNLTVAVADVFLKGQAVDSTTGESLNNIGVFGQVYALYADPAYNRFVQLSVAPLRSGTFELALSSSVATTYTIGLYFPPLAGYTALSRVVVNLNEPIPDSLEIPVAKDNSSISGTLRDRSGNPVTGIWGRVLAVSDFGGVASTRINPNTGTYNLAVATTDRTGSGGSFWRVRAFVDVLSGWFVAPPRWQRTFLAWNNGEGSDVTVDFTAVRLNAVITGKVLFPEAVTSQQVSVNPNPRRGVRVAVRLIENGDVVATRWTYTNREGEYRLRVVPGTYRIAVYPYRGIASQNTLIAPPPVSVEAIANRTTEAPDIQIVEGTATAGGVVTYNGAGYGALVRARAEDGSFVQVRTDVEGNYVLHLKPGVKWTLRAVSADESTFLVSEPVEVIPQPGLGPIAQIVLELQPRAQLPESQVYVFNSTEAFVGTLSDDSQVRAPAGAFSAADETITLTVRPLPDLAGDVEAEPVSFGYRLHAYNSNYRPITRFLQPITLEIPFTAEQLEELGITPDQLTPAYWDEQSQSWKEIEDVIVNVDENGDGTVSFMVDHFTDFALVNLASDQGVSATEAVYLPTVTR